ncbi:MAG: hypothetical protein NTW26_09610 [bacterium]|nr:hypothetical protein [bacterium]
MRKSLILGGAVVVILFAALTACSDSLSTGADNPLADRDTYTVSGTVYLGGYGHTATVGLRHMYTSPFTDYIEETTASQSGHYELPLGNLDSGWYACDAWFQTYSGSSTQFYWDSNNPHYFYNYNIYME